MAKTTTFGEALETARESIGMSKTQLAYAVRVLGNTAYRWEKQGTMPVMEMRIKILRTLAAAPRALLEALAEESGVTLESIGMALPPPPPPPAPILPTAPASQGAAPPVPANAQATIDDAVREAAEEIDVSPKLLRPALSRMLDRLARTGVPLDAASRMVLGVPKKPSAK
jgi:transcriptional regulator with XRE-family HTH domain